MFYHKLTIIHNKRGIRLKISNHYVVTHQSYFHTQVNHLRLGKDPPI